MRAVDQLLVTRVGVHGLHQALLHAERVVQHLHHRHEAVGGAAGVGDDFLGLDVELLVVDAVDERGVGAVARGGHDDQLGAGIEVRRGRVALGEEARALDDHVHTQLAPRQVLRVALAEHAQLVAVHADAALRRLDGVRQHAEHTVVLQEVGHLVQRAEVVDRHEIDVRAALLGSAEEVAPDAPETVDTDANRHGCVPFREREGEGRQGCSAGEPNGPRPTGPVALVPNPESPPEPHVPHPSPTLHPSAHPDPGVRVGTPLKPGTRTSELTLGPADPGAGQRAMSRWPVRTAWPRAISRAASSSAMATLRWWPPVQPTATVR